MLRSTLTPAPLSDPATLDIRCAAVCFDLDGVLVDSTAQIQEVITRWAAVQGVDLTGLHAAARSMTDREFVATAAPHLDPAAEAAAIQRLEVESATDTRPLPGALRAYNAVPAAARAIVTSGARPVVLARLAAARIPAPRALVTAEDVTYGKPHPQPYLDAVRRLGRTAGECVALEDSHNGALAAKLAGLTVIGVGSRGTDLAATADYLVQDMSELCFTIGAGTAEVRC
ncbi:HAD-IA family hydrolase [Nocardia sp. NPDC051832]|uniref:HAD-IA family hydrolase n=1 Tax=Nocardia sp. NPDC051832 TaxID=3155673 RepID=UPI0034457AA0